MTNIHFPVDGLGTQSLKKQNKADKTTFHVDATAPDSKNQNKNKNNDTEKKKSTAEKKQAQSNNAVSSNYQARQPSQNITERRHENRRKRSDATLLNTRSEQDRRKTTNQNPNNESFQSGIDTKA